jgi:hypothetical protein
MDKKPRKITPHQKLLILIVGIILLSAMALFLSVGNAWT